MNRLFVGIIVVLVAVGVVYWFLTGVRNNPLITDIAPTPTESPLENKPDSWVTYISDFGYKISYPKSYLVTENGDYSITIEKPSGIHGAGNPNFIYVSLVPEDKYESEGGFYNYNPEQFKKLQKLEVGDSVSLAVSGQDLDNWFTYTRVNDTDIDEYTARRFENTKPWEFPAGTKETRFTFNAEGNIYIIGYYVGGESVDEPIDERDAYNIIKTVSIK
jgi:hypothetical protein